MLIRNKIAIIVFGLFFSASVFGQLPCDKRATKETKKLFKNLHSLTQQKQVMFGHQDDLAYGVGWRGIKGDSDVKRSTGDYPSVFGWDLGHLESNSPLQIDSIPFKTLKEYIIQVYKMGGINTISWHLNNPSTGGSAWDTSGSAVRSVLPNGVNHDKYFEWLDKVADFSKSLKVGVFGKKIPFIFRPYHENTGSWFWWGEGSTSSEEFIALWRMTVDYLHSKGVHNILYAYSPDNFKSKEHYLKCYPGDDYVDIIGHDLYHRSFDNEGTKQYIQTLQKNLSILSEIAKEHNKVTALTETGLETIPVADWWTSTLWNTIEPFNISYVLVWRNGRSNHYYAPCPNNISLNDFRKFSTLQNVLFLNKTKRINLYK
jgi:mannan endo-1,4-beta-mannosidase